MDFLALHPRIEVELIAVDRAVNLVEERIDLAVRITNRLDDSFVARRLATCRSVLCASPAYLERHGAPAAPAGPDGAPLHHARLRHPRRIPACGTPGQLRPCRSTGALSSNETAVVRAGGAGRRRHRDAADLLRRRRPAAGRAGALCCPTTSPKPLGIHAVYLSRQHQPLPLGC